MNKTNVYYRIGPHILRIGIIPPIEQAAILPSFAPFILSEEEGERAMNVIEVDIQPGNVSSPEFEDAFPNPVTFEWENSRCTLRRQADGDYKIGIATLRNLAAEAYADCREKFHRNIIFLPESLLQMAPFVINNFLMMIYTFATAELGTLMIHASVVQHDGKGYLFLGKSGTGKSTHARLWLEHIEGCSLLNDDNPVVAVDPESGRVTVYGTPWSGKTPCYLNKSIPVGAIVRLEQAQRNKIVRLTAAHAFAALLPSCSCLKQDAYIYKGIVDTVTRIATCIPVCHLKCLPDEAAAQLCMQTVTQNDLEP